MNVNNYLNVDSIIKDALLEDIGSGDITTTTIIDAPLGGKAILLAKEEMVLAGMDIFSRVFNYIDPKIAVYCDYSDGDLIKKNTQLCTIKGSLRTILQGERTALNFLQHLSGVATLTRKYVEKTKFAKIRVIDTRKTTPGLRILEKYAVRMGGGFNHRFGLFDGVLIKENHIIAAGSITKAVERVRAFASHTIKIQVEVENLEELMEAIAARPDAILLDNMPIEQIREAVFLNAGKIPLEASGGIDLDTIEEIAKTGIDLVSVGRLTHSARSIDISLRVTPNGP